MLIDVRHTITPSPTSRVSMSRPDCKRVAPLGILLVTALLGCGGGDDNGGPSTPTIAIAKTSSNSGDGQSGTVGLALANPLSVVVTEEGAPLPGATVTWATTAAAGAMGPPSGVSNADGVATSTWTLGTASGAQTAQATVSGASGSPVTFAATALAGPATTMAEAGGDGQTAETGAVLALPVQARVTDEHGNGVVGAPVEWAATGGTVSDAVVTSSEVGLSEVNVTAGGSAGPIIITAIADGLIGSPLTFNATVVEPVPVPATAGVGVGNNFFRSNRNSTQNAAVDTVQVGGTVTWTWVPAAIVHSVDSDGSPSFTDSPLQTGPNYQFTFTAAGTYEYTCAAHPGQMTGRIVVR